MGEKTLVQPREKWPGEAHKQPQPATQYYLRARSEECLRIRNKMLTGDFSSTPCERHANIVGVRRQYKGFLFFWFSDTRAQIFFFEETRPRVETEGMPLPQPPEGTGQKRRFSRKNGKVNVQKCPCLADAKMSYESLRCKNAV